MDTIILAFVTFDQNFIGLATLVTLIVNTCLANMCAIEKTKEQITLSFMGILTTETIHVYDKCGWISIQHEYMQ